MLDLVVCIVTPFPIISMLCAVLMAGVEIFSMAEGTTKKAEIARGAKTMRAVIENPSDISRGIAVAVLKEIERATQSNDTPPPMTEADIVKLVTDLMRKANEDQAAPEADNATD